MSVEQLIEGISKRLTRRNVLVKMGVGSVAAVAGLLGVPRDAVALVAVYCCNLCENPDQSCSNCYCRWSWDCCDFSNHQRIRCWECFNQGGDCGQSCGGIKCSYIEFIGTC